MKNLLSSCVVAITLGISSMAFAQSQDCSADGATCSQNNASVDIDKSTDLADANVTNDVSDAFNGNSVDLSGSSQNNENTAFGQGGTATATGGVSSATGNLSNNDNRSSVGNVSNGGNTATTTGGDANTTGGSNTQGNITGGSLTDNDTGGSANGGTNTTSNTNNGQADVTGGTNTTTNNGGTIRTEGGAGGAVTGSGNSSSASKSGVAASGNSKQSQQASNKGVQNNTQVDARNQSKTEYNEAANTAYAAGIYGQSTAPCVKVSGIGMGAQTVGAGWTFNIRNDRESGNCITNQRVGMMQNLYGDDGAALYLAQQDPAAAAVIETLGLPSGRQVTVVGKGRRTNPLGQTTMAQPLIQNTAAQVCQIKAGTKKTIVTNWADKMACARKLGLAR